MPATHGHLAHDRHGDEYLARFKPQEAGLSSAFGADRAGLGQFRKDSLGRLRQHHLPAEPGILPLGQMRVTTAGDRVRAVVEQDRCRLQQAGEIGVVCP